ncbi:hypothetical protein COCMIDRAFT_96147, partial [Bipolaris oryzae ATCC 44560]
RTAMSYATMRSLQLSQASMEQNAVKWLGLYGAVQLSLVHIFLEDPAFPLVAFAGALPRTGPFPRYTCQLMPQGRSPHHSL